MQKATGIEEPLLLRALFGKSPDEVKAQYSTFKKRRNGHGLLEDLITFRGGEPFQIAVIDEELRRRGLFPFHMSGVCRVFRWGDIEPLKKEELCQEVNRQGSQTALTFWADFEERVREGEVVGWCRVTNWRTEPYFVRFTNTYIPDPRQSVGRLVQRKGWELVRHDNLPGHIRKIYNAICEKMREQKRTYIIFRPADYNLPHLFKSFPVEGQSGLAVAFGHNAFLVDSLISTTECLPDSS